MILNPIVSSDNGRMDVFSMNLENRIVLMTGEIDEDMSASIVSQLLFLAYKENAPISLYINSPGGSVSDGLAILDTMASLSCPVRTGCVGRAASMAAVILSAGEKGNRIVLPHSEVMVHQPSGGVGGQAEDIRIAAAHIGKLREELNQILAQNCGQPIEKIREATDRDRWMDAGEAIGFGIADRMNE